MDFTSTQRRLVIAAIFLVLIALAGWIWRFGSEKPEPAPVAIVRTLEPAPASADAVAAPAIRHPVQAIDPGPEPARALPELAQSDDAVHDELNTLLGRKKVDQFMVLDGIVRRIVSTVDNLGREHAPPSAWPLQATPGRFATLHRDDGDIVSPDNEQRYAPLVQFVEAVDSRKVVQFYARLYPLFQQAYVELGFPKGYFNDRLIAVIDLLLATPVSDAPLSVQRVEVQGPIASQRPWTHYDFTDPRLQSLAAGQKILLRTGPSNHRRLRAKLIEYRALLTRAALPAGVQP